MITLALSSELKLIGIVINQGKYPNGIKIPKILIKNRIKINNALIRFIFNAPV